MKIAEEQELLSVVTHALPLARRVLVLAPHPDDEVFGCGGTVALLREAGAAVSQVVLTDGAQGGDDSGGELAAVRQEESLAAARILGLPSPSFWREPDRGLRYDEVLIERLSGAIVETGADLVFLPAPTELHPDHQALAFAGAEALRRLGGARYGAFYEVSAPLPNPNMILDISSTDETKQRAMECFASQLREHPYDQCIAGLNRYRAITLGIRARSAEAFVLLPAPAIGASLHRLFEGLPVHRRRLGFAGGGEDMPLVSIIVRSMDRPTLAEALDSLARQTWPNLEVVVVNAKGGVHHDLGTFCGRFPLRLINQEGPPLTRPSAANLGLDKARGNYLGFLDDDDTFEPEHIHHLLAALQKGGGEAVAYAGVRGLRRDDPEQRELVRFAEPEVDFARLLLGNCIPIHAVLFPVCLLARGARFDETLDCYEDWDFWLQLARLAPFVFVDMISANYYMGGNSGVSPLAFDLETALDASRFLLGKWLMQIGPDHLQAVNDLYHKLKGANAGLNQAIAERDGQLAEREGQLAERDGQIVALIQEVAEKDRIIREIFASTSWRLSAPLRKIKNFLAGR